MNPKTTLRLQGFALVTIVLLLSACASTNIVISPTEGSEPTIEMAFYDARSTVIRSARHEIGDAYRYAGNGPEQWDCSGLAHYAYSKASIPIKRTTRDLSRMDKGITVGTSQPGDLIFFQKDGRVFHVSIITERNQNQLWVVHSTTSRGVIEEDIMQSSYWKSKIHKVISLAALAK